MKITTTSDNSRFRRLANETTPSLRRAVGDILDHGERRMTELVPRGASGKLGAAVGQSGPTIIGPGPAYRGVVGVDQRIAPYAERVNEGTGVDGPFAQSVKITRPSRKNPRRPGAMVFQKQGEPARFRQSVKFRPSSKIERNKNFVGRTYASMVAYSRVRLRTMTVELANIFTRSNH